jgi:uracil-DNA glycosylase family 4
VHKWQAKRVGYVYKEGMEPSLRSLLDWYERVGVETPDLPLARSVRRVQAKPAVEARPEPAPKPTAFAAADPAPIAAACKTLDALKSALNAFDAGALSDSARQVVFARGNPEASLMVIGDAPNQEDDQAGQPFTGRAGQLLDRMLGAIGLSEDDAYISNVCFWRPPHDRKPEPEELQLCRPFVMRQIELAKPKVILLTGSTSMQVLTGVTSIMKNRGQWQSITTSGIEIPVLPTYHPTFLIRQPALKAEAWQDLLTLRETLASL